MSKHVSAILNLILPLFIILGCSFPISTSVPTSSSSAVSSMTSGAVSVITKWLLSFKVTSKTGTSARSVMKFESGYSVETVFDGSKHGIDPYSLEILPNGELLILDSANSNVYKISASLTPNTRPKLIAGSAEGVAGHVDGRPRESRMNHPKGITVDERGNIYVADAMNMAIRKIKSSGITTIAGGRTGEEAKFSNDFDVVYIGTSCSLLVLDRGNKAIREIQLYYEDCVQHHQPEFPLGIAVLVAAGIFGYLTAYLQWKLGRKGQGADDGESERAHAQSALRKSMRPPLIRDDGDADKTEESFFTSLYNLVGDTVSAVTEIVGGVFPFFRASAPASYAPRIYEQKRFDQSWPSQERYEIPATEGPPVDSPTPSPTPQKTYAFMTKDANVIERQSDAIFREWKEQEHRHHRYYRHHSSQPQTVYVRGWEEARSIVHCPPSPPPHGASIPCSWTYTAFTYS